MQPDGVMHRRVLTLLLRGFLTWVHARSPLCVVGGLMENQALFSGAVGMTCDCYRHLSGLRMHDVSVFGRVHAVSCVVVVFNQTCALAESSVLATVHRYRLSKVCRLH